MGFLFFCFGNGLSCNFELFSWNSKKIPQKRPPKLAVVRHHVMSEFMIIHWLEGKLI